MQLSPTLKHNTLYSFYFCFLWNYTLCACGYVWESTSKAPSPYLCSPDIFNPLFDSINKHTSLTLWENSEKGQMKALTEEKTAVHKKYQRIYTKEETSKHQNLAENLKSEPVVDCKICIRRQRQLLLFTDLSVYKIWEQKHFMALVMHTITFIGAASESLKEIHLP